MLTAGTTVCAEDRIYVCGACGKTSTTRYGFDDAGTRTASAGWDESCMRWAVLCIYPRQGDTWEAAPEDAA